MFPLCLTLPLPVRHLFGPVQKRVEEKEGQSNPDEYRDQSRWKSGGNRACPTAQDGPLRPDFHLLNRP